MHRQQLTSICGCKRFQMGLGIGKDPFFPGDSQEVSMCPLWMSPTQAKVRLQNAGAADFVIP